MKIIKEGLTEAEEKNTLPTEAEDIDVWDEIYGFIVYVDGNDRTPKSIKQVGRRIPEDRAAVGYNGEVIVYSDDVEDFDRAKEVARRFGLRVNFEDRLESGYQNISEGHRYIFTIKVPEKYVGYPALQFKKENPDIFK